MLFQKGYQICALTVLFTMFLSFRLFIQVYSLIFFARALARGTAADLNDVHFLPQLQLFILLEINIPSTKVTTYLVYVYGEIHI